MNEYAQQTRPCSDADFESLVTDAKSAIDAHDARALAALFAPDGRVADENTEHVGWVAISQWFAMTLPILLETVETRVVGGTYTLIANGHGDYPGSPLTFRYDFLLSPEGIEVLSIALADPAAEGRGTSAESNDRPKYSVPG